jgi:steroid 5-alpha reductase family enzyme
MPISIYLINLLAVVFMMLCGWIFSVQKQNVTVVDSLWGIGFVLIAWLTLFQLDGIGPRALLITLLVTLWGGRLALYLTWRNYGQGEDPRYAQWRKAGGQRFWLTSLFKVFLLQALFLWAIALVIQAGQAGSGAHRLGWLDGMGALIWLTGFVFEAVGDWQLARFKSDPANRGRVMDRGLWRYTRHPNYFGESLIWWGLFVIALSDPANWWTIISPVIITAVVMKMTGIPLTEKLTVHNRPGYGEYIKNTSAFFPWVPRKPSNKTESYHENTDPIG